MSEDRDNILPDEPAEVITGRIRIPKRRIIIEPFQVLFAVSIFPMLFISQQYIVSRIRDDYRHANHSFEAGNGSSEDHGSCDVNKSSPDYQFQNEVQEAASKFNIYSSVLQSGPALFVTVFLGAYSDSKGRKYAILIPTLGNLISVLCYIMVILLKLPIWVLLIGSFLNGCCGSYQTLLLGCFAYIADQTTPEQRQFRIVVLELILFMSGILGPIGVGVWIEKMGFLPPLLFVGGGLFLSIIYGIFLIPETIIPNENAKFFQFENVKKTIALFTQDNESNRRWKLLMLYASFFLIGVVYFGSVDQLFELNHPLCWGSVMIGYFTTAYIGAGGVGGLVTAKLTKMCLGDIGIAFVAGIACFGNSVLKGFVTNTKMMFSTVAFAPFSILFIPTIRTLMSKLVTANEQGSVFGAIAFAEVVCSLIGTSTVNLVYKSTLHIQTGFVFFYMALVYLLGTTLIGIYGIITKLENNKYKQLQNVTTEPNQENA